MAATSPPANNCTRVIRRTSFAPAPPGRPPLSVISPILDKSKELAAWEQLVLALSERRFHGPASHIFADYLPAWNERLWEQRSHFSSAPPPASALSAFCIRPSLRAPHCSLLSSFSLLTLFLTAFPCEFLLCARGESAFRRD